MDEEIKIDETEVLKKVADTLTDEPVTVKVDILHPTKWERLMFKTNLQKPYREFHVKPASLSKFIKVSKLLLDVNVAGIDTTDIYGVIQGMAVSHGERLAEAVAVILHPGRGNPPKSLIAFLLDNLTNKEMQGIATIVLERSDAVSFLSSIISMKGINLLGMNPRTQGS